MRVQILSVENGKSQNWLKIYAYISQMDVNKKFLIEYCGTDAICEQLTSEQAEKAVPYLQKLFGYAPFNLTEAQKICDVHHSFEI